MTYDNLLELVIAALEECYDVSVYPGNGKTIQDIAIREAKEKLAESKPTPAAWMWTVNSGAGFQSRGIDFFPSDIPFAQHIPLYLDPPQREWKGLTDEEIEDIADDANYGYKDVARAIEAKLKEKNT